jgi:hypothetical protein
MTGMKPTAASVALLLVALLLAGCSGAPQATDSPGPASAEPVARPETPGAPPPTDEPSSLAPTSDPGDATDSPDGTPAPLFGGIAARVVLLTPISGGGTRPLLEWEPIPDADHYGAYVYAPDGSIYWAWTGRQTSVHVGGEPQLREGAAGPSVVDGMSWAVIAYDAELLPMAVSELRPISP